MDVWKQPVTDPSKGSKRGRLSLRRNSDGFLETVERGAGKPEEVSIFSFRKSACFSEARVVPISLVFTVNLLCFFFCLVI